MSRAFWHPLHKRRRKTGEKRAGDRRRRHETEANRIKLTIAIIPDLRHCNHRYLVPQRRQAAQDGGG